MARARLLARGKSVTAHNVAGHVEVTVPSVLDHEAVAIAGVKTVRDERAPAARMTAGHRPATRKKTDWLDPHPQVPFIPEELGAAGDRGEAT
jgi:hypothetical protein